MRIGILFRTGCFLFLFIRLEKPAKPAFLTLGFLPMTITFHLSAQTFLSSEKVVVRLFFGLVMG